MMLTTFIKMILGLGTWLQVNNKLLQSLILNKLWHASMFQYVQQYTYTVILTRGPWALTLCLRTNLAMGQGSKSCTYTLFLPQGVEIELIFALRAAVSEIWAHFQNCHIWA